MHIREYLNPIAIVTTATSVSADVWIHGMLTALSAIGVLVGIICHITQTALKWEESEDKKKAFKLQCFREWEKARYGGD